MALKYNVTINLDNDYEMGVVDDLLSTTCQESKSELGLRVNPVVGGGSVAIVSTATKLSKFGIPITENTKDDIVALYKQYSWLRGIHIHVGSQGVPLQLFVKGARVNYIINSRYAR